MEDTSIEGIWETDVVDQYLLYLFSIMSLFWMLKPNSYIFNWSDFIVAILLLQAKLLIKNKMFSKKNKPNLYLVYVVTLLLE